LTVKKEELDGLSQGTQGPDQLGQVDPEDHQGDEDGRRRQAAPRAGGGGSRPSLCPAPRERGREPRLEGDRERISPKLLAGTGKDQTHLFVVATSDKGLAGAFNTNIARLARRRAQELIAEGKTVKFYTIGRKGRAVLNRLFPKQIVHGDRAGRSRQAELRRCPRLCRRSDRALRSRRVRRRAPVLLALQVGPHQEPTEQQIIPVAIPLGSRHGAPAPRLPPP
jgi:hypothetical protein